MPSQSGLEPLAVAAEQERIHARRKKQKRPHLSMRPFKFWLPDLDSNQGPAD
jgi:hypothetical protein